MPRGHFVGPPDLGGEGVGGRGGTILVGGHIYTNNKHMGSHPPTPWDFWNPTKTPQKRKTVRIRVEQNRTNKDGTKCSPFDRDTTGDLREYLTLVDRVLPANIWAPQKGHRMVIFCV